MVLLEDNKLFGQLARAEMETLRAMARELSFAAGQRIFTEGDLGDGLYAVKEGVVEISVLVGQNVRRPVSRVQAGDVFGEMAVVDDQPRSACASAVEPTTVYFIPRPAFLALLEQSPALSLSMLREISLRLREFNRLYMHEVLREERLVLLGRFARSIVHDLKNPLHVIGLTSEVMFRPQSSAEARRRAQEAIRGQIEAINELVGEILAFTQTSRIDLLLAPMDYAVYVRDVLEEIRPEATLRSVAIELDGPGPDAFLEIDPKRLRRVFVNLIHNAIEAMPGGGKIYLRFSTRDCEQITEIEDTGPGIAPEMNGQLFDVFATHGKTNGTGLGLSICKRIVEDHRGWVAARNSPRGGAVFAFGLPLPRTS
jgi:signal transduction histidine kinase